MYKTLVKVLFGVIVIIIIAYLLNSRANTPEACANINGLWNSIDEVCETPTKTIIFQSLSKPNPLSILYPDSQQFITLNHVEKIDDFVYFRGHYNILIQAENDESESTYVRGSMYFNMSKFTLLTANTSGIAYFSAPFTINTVENDAFVYIGLFSYDFSSHQATHLDSELLGNHIREETLLVVSNSTVNNGVVNKSTVNNSTVNKNTVNNSTVNKSTVNNSTVNNITINKNNIDEQKRVGQRNLMRVTFKAHGLKQSASDYPTQLNEVSLQLIALDPSSNKNASFERVKAFPTSALPITQ